MPADRPSKNVHPLVAAARLRKGPLSFIHFLERHARRWGKTWCYPGLALAAKELGAVDRSLRYWRRTLAVAGLISYKKETITVEVRPGVKRKRRAIVYHLLYLETGKLAGSRTAILPVPESKLAAPKPANAAAPKPAESA